MWRIALAFIGLLFIRRYLYKKYWGHGEIIGRLFGIAFGFAFFIPLYYFDPTVALVTLTAGTVVLVPYGSYFRWKLKRETKKGVEKQSFHIHIDLPCNNQAEIVVRSSEDVSRPVKCEIYGDVVKGLTIPQLKQVLRKNPKRRFLPT